MPKPHRYMVVRCEPDAPWTGHPQGKTVQVGPLYDTFAEACEVCDRQKRETGNWRTAWGCEAVGVEQEASE